MAYLDPGHVGDGVERTGRTLEGNPERSRTGTVGREGRGEGDGKKRECRDESGRRGGPRRRGRDYPRMRARITLPCRYRGIPPE
jgi:hypothetical protein